MAREAAAQHYLTDAFAAGHLRTPVADIRRYWRARYPAFWDQLQRKVASDTATALRETSALMSGPALYSAVRPATGAGIFAVPVLGTRLGDVFGHAYHQGFVEPLAHDPAHAVLGLVHAAEAAAGETDPARPRGWVDDRHGADRLPELSLKGS